MGLSRAAGGDESSCWLFGPVVKALVRKLPAGRSPIPSDNSPTVAPQPNRGTREAGTGEESISAGLSGPNVEAREAKDTSHGLPIRLPLPSRRTPVRTKNQLAV